MIDQTNLRRYAENLYMKSENFSTEEALGLRIITLLDHAHNPEMVLEKLQGDILMAAMEGEEIGPLHAAIKKIREG